MNFTDLTLASGEENLALDEALLLAAESGAGGEVLRLWEWPSPAVVLGAAGKLAEDVDEATCARDGVPILRRSSGGGTVLLGKGCLLYSLVLAFDRDPALREIPSSYCYILGRILESLTGLLPDLCCAGTSDLTSAGRKFSGNAQQRKRTHLLHHGTLLYDFDLALVGRYLKLPERRPEYRGDRAHESFLTNLPATREALAARLCRTWGAAEDLGSTPNGTVRRLVAEKYGREDWTRRR